MTVTSFLYLTFLLVGVIIYYIFPKKVQWLILLGMSILFYCLAATPYTIIYLIISTAIAYISTNLIQYKKIASSVTGRNIITFATCTAVLVNVLIWFLLKGDFFWDAIFKVLHKFIPSIPAITEISWPAALGMGYYTAQIISYILDSYWGNCHIQKNFFKLFLYVCFFPQLTVGPISRYTQMECLYKQHCFSYENICFGSQRILWGFFKKLVLSDRIGIIVENIWSNTGWDNTLLLLLAILLYPLQIYTDFSGCMDIILGSAELFDLKLPENFKNPFFARTCQEFWQRWHITLGNWARDYIYYPVLKSHWILSIGKWSKRYFKKRTAKLIPWSIGTLILWLVMGFWHGSIQYMLGVSIWFGFLLIGSEIVSPLMKRVNRLLNIDVECFSWRLYQHIRTYLLFSIGCIFFSSHGLRDALHRLYIVCSSISNFNLVPLMDENVVGWVGKPMDLFIIGLGIVLLITVGILRETHGYARIWMARQILPFRWFFWLGLLAIIIIFGMYGIDYDTSSFIYQVF